jgi:hypothetical protein
MGSVSCVSSVCWVNASETHETFRRASGMRYQTLNDNILWLAGEIARQVPCPPPTASRRAKTSRLRAVDPPYAEDAG